MGANNLLVPPNIKKSNLLDYSDRYPKRLDSDGTYIVYSLDFDLLFYIL